MYLLYAGEDLQYSVPVPAGVLNQPNAGDIALKTDFTHPLG